MVGHQLPPVAVAHEQVQCRHRATDLPADEVLVDGDPGGVAGHLGPQLGQDELQHLLPPEEGEPRAGHGPPAP
jgi:hypothetical protein